MKIVAVRGENLASLEEFDIDFEGDWCDGSGLFAVTGPTGAGKSTILDAIALALYDQTPRLQGRSRTKIVPLGDTPEIASNDPRLLLRNGTGEGKAVVDFVAGDGEKYRAQWTVRRAHGRPGGNLQTQDVEFFGLDPKRDLTGGTRTETLEAIEEKLGLSFDQFCRSAMLAQGDFAAFLKADSAARAELLERMTGTEIYSELSKAAHERKKREAETLSNLEAQIDNLNLLDEAELEATGKWHEAAAERRDSLEREVEEAKSQIAWFERVDELTEKVREANEELEEATQEWEEMTELRAEFERVEEVAHLRASYEQRSTWARELEEAKQNLETLQKELKGKTEEAEQQEVRLEDAAEAHTEAKKRRSEAEEPLKKARKLDERLEQRRNAVKDATAALEEKKEKLEETEQVLAENAEERQENREAIEQLDEWSKDHAYVAPVAEHRALCQKTMEEFRDLAETISEKDEERARLSKQVEAREKEKQNLAAEVDRLKKEVDEKKEELAQKKESTGAERLAELQNRDKELEENRKALEEAQECAEAVLSDRETLEALEASLVEIADAKESTRDDLTENAEATKAKQQLLDTARDGLEGWRHALGMEDKRQLLTDGEACPLCGATEHPWRQEESPDFAKKAERLKQQVKEHEDEVSKLKQTRGELENTLKQLDEEAEELSGEREKCRETLDKQRNAWKTHREGLEGLSETVEDAVVEELQHRLDGIADEKEKLERQREEITDAIAAVEAVEEELDKLQKSLAEQESKLASLRDEIRDETTKRDNLRETLEDLRERKRDAIETLSTPFGDWPGWRDELTDAPATFAERSLELVDEWRQNQDRLSDLREKARSLEQSREELQKNLDEKKEAREQAEKELTKAKEALETCEEERNELFDGRAADEVQKELDEGVDAAAESLEEAREEKNELDQEIKSISGSIETTIERRDSLCEKIEARDDELDDKLAKLDLDRDALASRLDRDEEWVKKTREEVQAAKETLETAKKVHQERRDDLKEYREENEEPPYPRDQIERSLEELDVEHERVGRFYNRLDGRLQTDRDNREKAEDLTDELNAQGERLEVWQSLADLIGSSSGKTFRNYAQGLTLDVLLGYANEQLKRLKPRYRLERIPGAELDLQIVDHDMGDDIRSVESLSGGETFLVSLALALGLSSLTSNRTRVDSLFIDEGFGSLDAESLEQALATLDALQAQGRTVGVISHVPGLSERVGAEIRVVPKGDGRSSIEYPPG